MQDHEPALETTSNATSDTSTDATLLVTVSGPDQRGITSTLMELLSLHGAVIDDAEQVVVRGHLVLGVIAKAASDRREPLRSDLDLFAAERGLHITVVDTDPTPTPRRHGVIVTAIAPQVTSTHFNAVARAIAAAGGNIDRIVRLARYPVSAYELQVQLADLEPLRSQLVAVSREFSIDIAIQPEGLGRRAQRLVVMDVDSTLIQDEVIELIADLCGCGDRVKEITDRAMAGEIDFEQSLRERVRLLKGLQASELETALSKVRLTPGARTFTRTLRRLGFRIAIVSGGFTYFTDALKTDLELDYAFANELEIIDGVLTGELTGPVVDRARKAELLRYVAELEGIALDQTVAVGDGANDLDMLAVAGLGIAFNAKPVVRNAASATLNVPYLDAVLFMLGVSRSEVEAADEAEGYLADYPPVEP